MKMGRLWLLLASLFMASSAGAETYRLALVVGHNTGSGEHPNLRFAETDAGKFAEVLADVGNVESADIQLLQGLALDHIRSALSKLTARVGQLHRSPQVRVVLIFYFSGHSDGVSVELGPEKLSFLDLKQMLSQTGADVRLAIIDACKSGAAVRDKGGEPAPAFAIRLRDELRSSGDVLLTSSAADEVALESDEVRGSYFTHHLVSGLRGAADQSGDGQVTLAEAYRYAYHHTVSSSAATLNGPHHPVYDYRLSGQGELVLAFLNRLDSALVLDKSIERALIIGLERDHVLAELGAASARKVALPAGQYGIRAFRNGQNRGTRLRLAPGEIRQLEWAQLESLDLIAQAQTKGAVAAESPAAAPSTPTTVVAEAPVLPSGPHPWQWQLTGGIGRPVAQQVDLGGRLRLAFHRDQSASWVFSLQTTLAVSTTDDLYESMAQAGIGYRLAWQSKRVDLAAALELSPGLMWQTLAGEVQGSSFIFCAGPRLSLWFHVTESLSIGVEAEAFAGILQIDDATRTKFFPSLLAGLALRL